MKKSKKEYPYYYKEGDQEFVTYLLYGGIECTMSVDNAKGVGISYPRSNIGVNY
jgi:hypothetical protein